MSVLESPPVHLSGQDYLCRVAGDAVEIHGVPPQLVKEARLVTGRRLAHLLGRAPSAQDKNRIHAYFWGVVRRTSIDSRGARYRSMRERYFVSSVVSDLREAGRSGSDIVAEIESAYGASLDPETLREFRERLCG